jgi:hypothetical protein
MELFEQLWLLILTLGRLAVLLLWIALLGAPLILWVAWWLWAVDWRKFWPTLAQGAWAPVVLLALIVAMALAYLVPAPQLVAGVDVPSPWWQLGAVALAVAVVFLCGWLQGAFGWYPPAPVPVAVDDHGHHHDDHGHSHAHADDHADHGHGGHH